MNETLGFVLAIAVWFGGSRVIAAVVALLVDVFKRFGLVKDGDAGKWSAALNLIGLAGFSAYFLLNPSVPFADVDGTLQLVLNIALVVLAYVDQLDFSTIVHWRGVDNKTPLFYSHPKSSRYD